MVKLVISIRCFRYQYFFISLFAGKFNVLLKSQGPYNQQQLALNKMPGQTQPRSSFYPQVF